MAEYRVKWQDGPRGFCARVQVERAEADVGERAVTLSAPRIGPVGEVDDWHRAAKFGARIALEFAGSGGRVRVMDIHGMQCDCNPTIVAIATVRATWRAIAFEPPEEIAAALDSLIPTSDKGDVENVARALSS